MSAQSCLSPRKTPRQARSQASVEAILEAATRIISEGGLAAFNTNAVAQRAGVSIGSLYQYFPNKDALMAALIARQQQRQFDAVAGAMAQLSSTSLAEAVRTIINAAISHHSDDGFYASAVDHEEDRLLLDREIGTYLDRSGAFVATLIARFADEIGPIDVDKAVRTLPVLVRAISDRWANLNPPRIETAQEEATKAVLGYLRQN